MAPDDPILTGLLLSLGKAHADERDLAFNGKHEVAPDSPRALAVATIRWAAADYHEAVRRRAEANARYDAAERAARPGELSYEEECRWERIIGVLTIMECNAERSLCNAVLAIHGRPRPQSCKAPKTDDWPACAFECDGNHYIVTPQRGSGSPEPILIVLDDEHFDCEQFGT